MPEFTFRPMQKEDVEQVAAIELSNFSEPWSARAFSVSLLDTDAFFITACADEEVIGYAGFYKACEDGDICNVAVREDYRRQGVGEKMLLALMEYGRKMGIANFTLEVRVGNAEAIALYKKLGFEESGIRPGFYRKPTEDALIMWKMQDGLA